ncbi:MAG: DUF2889 domain-containing protein [Thermoplasmata archaeon]|nr:DUF2889 domain-containing protein [Thermoplasmata archaeon]
MLHQITERTINMKILELTADTVLARGSILDQVHNIAIELEIDINTLEIIKAEGQMVKAPFQMCKAAINNLDSVVGFKLKAGISNQLGNVLGGKNGCIHLSEVTIETARLAANTIFGIKCGGKEWREGTLSDEEFWGRVKPLLKGTCSVFKCDEDTE